MDSCRAAAKERNVNKHKVEVPTLETESCNELVDYCIQTNYYKKVDIESILNEENNHKNVDIEQEQDKERTIESYDYSR